jgi:hypothetical protein
MDKPVKVIEFAGRPCVSIDEGKTGPLELVEVFLPTDLYHARTWRTEVKQQWIRSPFSL